MSFLRNPDYKEGVRGDTWYPCIGTVRVPVASGETIYDGDLVSMNANGEAVNVRPATAGAQVGATPNIFGIALSSSAAQASDPELYDGIVVQPLNQDRFVVLPFADNTGAPATPAKSNIGAEITLRAGAGAYAGVLVCNVKSGSDNAHGRIMDVAGKRVVVALYDSALVA